MESKRARVRKYFTDSLSIYDFQWNFTSDEFEDFKSFFESDLVNGEESFIIQILDPNDSEQLIITDYGFFDGGYEFNYSDGVYNVQAAMVVEEETLTPIVEPEIPDLCAIIIWPSVSDGEGGGTTFECYTATDYTTQIFTVAGTNITIIYHSNGSLGFQGGEEFETFPVGDLFLGSPSIGSQLLLMRYSSNPLGFLGGIEFEDDDEGGYMDDVQAQSTGTDESFSSNGP